MYNVHLCLFLVVTHESLDLSQAETKIDTIDTEKCLKTVQPNQLFYFNKH